jgi:Uma2 family endonuclease
VVVFEGYFVMAIADIELHHWNREEYERLAEAGFFPPEARLELIDGLIYHMAPQTSFHSTGVRAAQETLREIFSRGFVIRTQMPLALGEDSEPEPDVAVVAGHLADFSFSHPTSAVLIVEVADSYLLHDRRRKMPLYARFGIQEAWLVVLRQKVVEVFRDPMDGAYRSHTVLRLGGSVSPVARPEVSIAVETFFPWAGRRPRQLSAANR